MATNNKTSSKTNKKEVKVETKKEVKPSNISNPNYINNVRVVSSNTPSYGISGKEGALDSSEVYDEADIASALEAGFIAQALEKHKEKVAPETHPDFDGTHCIDCGEPIPSLRLAMFKVRCVDCQSELEKMNKIFGRK